ncbi:MAG: ADP-ribosylglycohydrolase family protein [Desulfonatronovibrionaceae bacterium]
MKHKDFQLFTRGCRFTDDTVLTAALADSILTGRPYEENLRRFYLLYPDAGYGESFQAWARDPDMGPYNSWGNGAAMRISPAGFAFDSLEIVLDKAAEFSALTHNHPG